MRSSRRRRGGLRVVEIAVAAAVVAGSTAASGALAAATGSLVIGALAGAAVSVAGGFAQQALAGGRTRERAAAITGSAPVAEAAGSRWRILGRRKVAGALIAPRATGVDGTRWQLLTVASHRIEGVHEHRLDGEPVSIDGDGWVVSPAKWAGLVRILVRDGTQTEAIPELVEAWDHWTEAHVGHGLALVAVQQKQVHARFMAETYPRGDLVWTGLVDGDPTVLDPRDGGRRWSRNAALGVLHHLITPAHLGGFGLPEARVDMQSFAAGAVRSDALDAAGRPMYRADAVLPWVVEGDPAVDPRLEDLLAACGGRLHLTADGLVALRLSPLDEVVTLESAEVEVLRLSPGVAAFERRDSITARFPSESHDGEMITAPAVRLAEAAAEDRPDTIDLPAVGHHRQARRLAASILSRRSAEWTATATCRLAARRALRGGAVRLDLPQAPEGVVHWAVRSGELDPETGTVSLQLDALRPDFGAEPADVEPPPLPLVAPGGGVVGAPVVVGVSTVERRLPGGGTALALRVHFTPPAEDVYDVELQLAEAGADPPDWQDAGSGPAASGRITSGLLNVADLYDGQVRFVGPGGGATLWTPFSAADVALSGDVPEAPTAFSATAIEEGVTLQATAPAAGPVARLRFLVGVSDDVAAAKPRRTRAASNGQTVTADLTGLSPIQHWAWVSARSDEDVDGPATGPQTFTPVITP